MPVAGQRGSGSVHLLHVIWTSATCDQLNRLAVKNVLARDFNPKMGFETRADGRVVDGIPRLEPNEAVRHFAALFLR